MRFLAFFFFLVCIYTLPAGAVDDAPLPSNGPANGDVRNFVWGVGREDVKQYEKGMYFDEQDNALFFLDYIHEARSLITYEFYKDKLYRVRIDFQKRFTDEQKHMDMYYDVQREIEEQLGPPVDTEFLWLGKQRYKDRPDYWGTAVYMGDLRLRTTWRTQRTDVMQSLRGKDFKPEFTLIYTGRDILAEKEREEAEDLPFVP